MTDHLLWLANHDGTGHACPKNVLATYNPSDSAPAEVIDSLSLGDGVLVYQFSPNPQLLDLLSSSSKRVAMQKVISNALPEDVPLSTRVMFGLGRKLEDSALKRPEECPITMLIYSHDPVRSKQTHDAINKAADDAMRRSKELTMSDIWDTQLVQTCCDHAKRYRSQLAANLSDKLSEELHAQLPGHAVLDQVQTSIDKDNGKMHVMLDYNVGSTAVVFQSLETGATCIFPAQEDDSIVCLPASDGRTVSYCDREDPLAQDLVATNVADKIKERHDIAPSCIVHAPLGHNRFVCVDQMSSTYKKLPLVSAIQATTGPRYIMRCAPLLTVVQSPRNVDGLVHGHIPCDTLETLFNMSEDSETAIVPNTAHFNKILINASVNKAAYDFMGPHNAVADSANHVAGYRVNRKEVGLQ